MSRLVVVGTGGMGREAAAWVADAGRGEDLVGFLDDDPATHGASVAELPVLGDLGWLDGGDDVGVVLGVGSPASRARLLDELERRDVPVVTIVHPSAQVGPGVEIGPGCVICPNVLLTREVVLGGGVICNYGAMVGHDSRIGRAVFIAPGAHLAGAVTVDEQADVGIGASVIQGVTVGARSVVGAGAVVIRDVAPDTTVVGVPARPLQRRSG